MRAIHKHLLSILIEYLGELVFHLGRQRSRIPFELRVRKFQAEQRLEFLEQGGFSASKSEVLTGLCEFVHNNTHWKRDLGLEDLSDIESRATNDTVSSPFG